MIIKSNNSFIKYESSEPLNLMEPPPKDSENNLYADYFNFINNVSSIYETQTINGNIPVFITKPETNSNSGTRIPDPDSTLTQLKPGRSYKITVISGRSLPIRVPNPIGLNEFLNDKEPASTTVCDKIFVDSPYDDNKIVLSSGVLSTNISIPISGLQPHKEYSFSFSPIFSNWPAKITPASGIIRRAGPVNNSYTSTDIEAVFSYYPYLLDNLDSIPYSINGDMNKDYYTDNVFTVLNLDIQDSTCSVYNNNYIIQCSGCVEDYSDPSINFQSSNNSIQNFIHASISDLNPNIDYAYTFKSINANWPSNITPQSGIIKRKNIIQGSSVVHGVLSFAKSITDPSNLAYILEPVSDDNYGGIIKRYVDLELSIEPINGSKFNKVTQSKTISYSVPTYFETTIKFAENNTNGVLYPILNGSSGRPQAEFTAVGGCCQEAFILYANIRNAKLGEKYTYNIVSYPSITLLPSSGVFATDNAFDTLQILAYLDGQTNCSVYVTLTHDESQNSVSDSILLRCPQSSWTQ